MRHLTIIKWVLMAGFICSPLLAQAQLLKGKLVNVKEDIALNYAPDGNIMYAQYHPLKVAADGTFTFDMEMTQPTTDVIIYVGEKGT